jgi:hypothetical protein
MGSSSLIRVYSGEPVPYSEGQLRTDILPAKAPAGYLPDDFLAQFNVFRVKNTPMPPVDITEIAKEEEKPVFVDGVWTKVWRVVRLPLEQAQNNIRSQRDGLLRESDWVVIMHTEKGTDIPSEWEVYRQALRDITAQEGFPYAVTWPTKPE